MPTRTQSALSFCERVRSTLLESADESFNIPDVQRVAQVRWRRRAVAMRAAERAVTKACGCAQAFASQVQFLFKVLNGARVQQSAPHLARLLLRLDFSGYYSSTTSAAS